MHTSGEPKVLWVTNNAAPYRVPVWESLAEKVDLKIRLLQRDDEVLSDARRSEEWTVSSARSSGLDVDALKTFRVGRGERLYYGLLQSCARLARGCDAVLLGAWESPACWQLSSAAKRRGVRRVGFYESTRQSQRHQAGPIGRARGHFFRSMDAVVVPGPAAADALLDMGVAQNRIFEGFNAVDVDRFAAVAHVAPEGKGHRFLYVGQLIARKNVDGLIRAFARCAQAGDTLTIVGKGEMEEQLWQLSSSLGLDGRVHFVGASLYADLPSVMSHHHTLVLPSTEEVWGLVVNEALAAGRHVVVSELAGVQPSVKSMPGVFTSGPEIDSLTKALDRSRGSWTGPVVDPPISKRTPQGFADTFLEAFRVG